MSNPMPRPLPVLDLTAIAVESSDDELRKSNGVDGFRYSRLFGIFYVVRLVFALPLLPLWPFLIAWEARDASIAKDYFGTMSYALRTIYTHVRFGSFVRMVKYNLLWGPEEAKARIAQRRGACTRCAKCCKQYDCIFLGQDAESRDYYCKVYQTNYWYYGTCGRFPLDQNDIDHHACPGFSFEVDQD